MFVKSKSLRLNFSSPYTKLNDISILVNIDSSITSYKVTRNVLEEKFDKKGVFNCLRQSTVLFHQKRIQAVPAEESIRSFQRQSDKVLFFKRNFLQSKVAFNSQRIQCIDSSRHFRELVLFIH